MSQNKQAMNLIQRKSGAEDILLRPLCAKLLPPTLPEQKGWVNREELLAISGRSREEQLKLAREFGIKDIPSPAGGCLLTDPAIGSRVQKVLRENRPLTPLTAELLTLGRHIFEEDRWMVLGRNREENRAIFDLVHPHHLTYSLNEPSPLAVILQGEKDEEALKKWLMKYSKKAREAIQRGENVKVTEIKTKNEI
jgi:tRNA-specific 2-thiouridylase